MLCFSNWTCHVVHASMCVWVVKCSRVGTLSGIDTFCPLKVIKCLL